jgi:hypothetical protein
MKTKIERVEEELGIKMVPPFSVGDNVSIVVQTRAGNPDFVTYKLLVPLQTNKWLAAVTDEDNSRVAEGDKLLDIEEEDIQDFSTTIDLDPIELQKAPVHKSISQDWDVF